MSIFAWIVVALLLLLIIGVPVGLSLGIIGIVVIFIFFGGSAGLIQFPHVVYRTLDDFIIVAIPLFVLMGYILMHGGVGYRLYDFANKWLRHLPGGVGIATMVSCAFFAALSGSSMATAVTIGMISVPEMLKQKYPRALAFAIVATGGTLGILIPPSLPLILYGALTFQSVGALFVAGIVPGVLRTLLYIFYIGLRGAKEVERQPPASWKERAEATKNAVWGLMIPVVIIGGIYTGIFTPTEAAAIGFMASLFVCVVIYKTIKIKDLFRTAMSSASTTGMLVFIILGALLFGHVLTGFRLPQILSAFVLSLDVSPLAVLLVMCAIWFILGMFLEVASIMLITLPIFFPIAMAVGLDPIWFAIVMVVNLEIALVTPPIGMNLFALIGVSKQIIDKREKPVTIGEISRAMVPFIIVDVISLALLIAFPIIALVLVK